MGSRGVAVLACVAGILAVVVAVALVFLFNGARPSAAAPSTPPATSRPEATPTSAPVLEPTVPFGGDCTRVLTASQVPGLLGEEWQTLEKWQIAHSPEYSSLPELPSAGTLGGIECGWVSPESRLGVVVLPAAKAPADFAAQYATQHCEPLYDTDACGIAATVGAAWVYAWVTGVPGGPRDLPERSLAEVSASVGNGVDSVPVDVGPQTLRLPDCEELAAAIRLDELIGPYITGYWEGNEHPRQRLYAEAGAEKICPWFTDHVNAPTDQEFHLVDAVISVGGVWKWPDIAGTVGAEAVELEGAGEAVAFSIDRQSFVYATDGTNVFLVDGHDLAMQIELAERLMAELGD